MAEQKKAPAARVVGSRKGKRRGRRPLSQRAQARGVDVKPLRGRSVSHERSVAHEGHEGKKPRMSRQKAGPSSHEIAVQGSRDTAKQRRTRKTLGVRAGQASPTSNPRTRARSKRRGARAVGTGPKRA